ncbi:MAG: hypothetical protein QME84_09985 [Actinomycetota bacterium]|nr:hypothetical protein [Actinomycetota bacterium]
MTNLDIQCAELGHQLAQINGMEEKVLNAALTVLEEQGPYAMFLYVKAQHEKIARQFSEQCVGFLKRIFGSKAGDAGDVLDVVKKLAQDLRDLDDLLFARDLLRTALSYARYHLKAKEGGSS